MRPLNLLLSAALVPGLLALPAVSLPAASAGPVAPDVQRVALQGVDPAALRAHEDAVARAAADARARDGLGAGTTAAGESVQPQAAPTRLQPAVATPEIVADDDFRAVGVSWSGDAGPVEVVVRVREDGGWSPWHVLPAMDEGPDAGSEEARRARTGTSPLNTSGADAVQVRVDTADGRAPQDVRVDLVDGGTSEADTAPAVPPASASARSSLPVITRAQWGADERLRNGTGSTMTAVKAITIHHTASTNNYSQSGAYQQIRDIYAYHTVSLGWADIGYNILVDRYGRIFEGRYGSLAKAVQGAHASGFNAYTQGVSVMGNFHPSGGGATVPTASVNAVGDAVAWLSARFGVNPHGTTQLTSAGGTSSRYSSGKVVTLPTVFPHRQTSTTACPGDSLYWQMGNIRNRAASQLGVGLANATVSASVMPYGQGELRFSADVPTVQRFTTTATPVCSTTPVRTWTGTSSGGRLTWTWSMLDGTQYLPVPPGVYRISMVTTAASGQSMTWQHDVEVTGATGAPVGVCGVTRLTGADRFATSVETGKRAAPTSTAVVIASGEQQSIVDGLAAGPFARTVKAPLLLATRAELPAVVADDIARRGSTTAWVVGGTGAIGSEVEAQLRSLGVKDVRRLAGQNRYQTAAEVARTMGAPSGRVLVASGYSLVDAASAGGAGAGASAPVLLAGENGLPPATRSAVDALNASRADVVGSAGVLSDAVISQLRDAGVGTVSRRGGADRYETATAVAAAFDDQLGTAQVTVTSGEDGSLVDAMSASALGTVTVLTRPGALPPVTDSYLASARPDQVVVAGSTGVVATPVLIRLSSLTR